MKTNFRIMTTDNLDDDLPLSYKFSLYLCQEDYELEKSSGQDPMGSRINLLRDYSVLNEITLLLPEPLKTTLNRNNPSILIMVSVSDSIGAVTNLT